MKVLISTDSMSGTDETYYLVSSIFKIIKSKYTVKPYLYMDLIYSELLEDLDNDRMDGEFSEYVITDTIKLIVGFIRDKENGESFSLDLDDYTILASRLDRITCITRFLIKEY